MLRWLRDVVGGALIKAGLTIITQEGFNEGLNWVVREVNAAKAREGG
jgi:hypothetical protein